jgi:hypothetical protein
MSGGRQIVDPPLYTPLPYGLLSVVDFPVANDQHWQNGITYQPNCATPSSTYDECLAVTGTGNAPSPPAFQNTVSLAPRGATAFSVFVEFDCSAVGNEEADMQARAAFASSETWQVERSFWTGVAGGQPIVFPHLAANAQILDAPVTGGTAQNSILLQTAAVVVTGAAGGSPNLFSSTSEVLGALEGALADCYNGVGVIHIPQVALPSFDAYGLIKTKGARMYTANGNKVSVGAGYPGTSPAGAVRTPDQCWIYATGNIMCYRGAVKVRASGAQAMDKQKNTIKMIAERRYLLGWDCCHFAGSVGLGVPKAT